jgi:hypothetical protein
LHSFFQQAGSGAENDLIAINRLMKRPTSCAGRKVGKPDFYGYAFRSFFSSS